MIEKNQGAADCPARQQVPAFVFLEGAGAVGCGAGCGSLRQTWKCQRFSMTWRPCLLTKKGQS